MRFAEHYCIVYGWKVSEEGVAAALPQAEDIIDNGIVSGMTATDAQKISSLKHAAPALWRGCVFDVHIGLIRGKTI